MTTRWRLTWSILWTILNDMKTSTEILREHFEQLKKTVPEVYAKSAIPPVQTQEDKLFEVVKKTLSIIEAVYFQNREAFTLTRAEEYTKVIQDLEQLGFSYKGNEELLEKAAAVALMKTKLPMEKATGKSSSDESKKVG